MRKILFVTGIRSEYDVLFPVIKATQQHRDFEASLCVTGAHLSPIYGYTYREVLKDGFPIAGTIENLLNSDSPAGRVKSAAIQLASLVDLLGEVRPHFVVSPMDREEAITVALAGAYMKIPVVHIGGGETAEDGNIDNAIRHAVTKLSHLHMVGTQRSAERVIQLGEEPWRVHNVGDPALDRFTIVPQLSDAEFWTRLGYGPIDGPFAILIQHPILTQADEAGKQAQITLGALAKLDIPIFIGYPNSDPGSHLVIEAINQFAARHPQRFHVYRNLPRELYVNLLRRAAVLAGNSSSGLIEAPLLRLPVVNIGDRQRGREHTRNVQFVGHDEAAIIDAMRKALQDTDYRRSLQTCDVPYGDGHAGQRIVEILARHADDPRLLIKRNTF